MTLWEAAVKALLEVEGGYSNDERDLGGETRYGVSKRSYPHLDIAALTREEAIAIYEADFWARIPATLPDGLRWMAFDSAVNHGVGTALGWLAESDSLATFTARRLVYYAALSGWPTFGKGWVKRVAHVLRAIDAHGRADAPPDDAPASSASHAAATVVLHSLDWRDRMDVLFARASPVTGEYEAVLRGGFAWKAAGGKVDVRRATRGS